MQYTPRSVYEFISEQTSDPIVERRICRVSGIEFPIFQSEINFLKKIAPAFDGKKFAVPLPTLCPEERQRRRLIHRNEKNFYRTTCAMSGEPIIALHTPDKPWTVYKNSLWFSDRRDPMDYAQDIDFTLSFTEQFFELEKKVPTPNIMSVDCENSDYTSGTGYCKDCYMICASEYAEKCMYSKLCQTAKYVLDSANVFNSEHIYQSYNVKECNNCTYLFNSVGCYHSHFSDSLISCSYCLFCTNLQNKQYHIYNKPVSKEEFEQAYRQSLTSSEGITAAQKEFDEVLSQSTLRYAEIERSEHAYGNELFDCKNVVLGYSINEGEDCRYCLVGEKVKSVYDCNNMYVNPELSYEVMGTIATYNCHFSTYVFDGSRDIWYSINCHACHNCFGCIGLRNKSHCIFNKQYTKEEYEKNVAALVSHMIETKEWGEFFDYSLAPFGYNESVAQDIYPLERDQAKQFVVSNAITGLPWSDYNNDPKIPEGVKVLKAGEISDSDWDVLRDDPVITRQVVICAVSSRPFMFQKSEIEFYKLHQLPLPRFHPDVRHEQRVQARPPKSLHSIQCNSCGKTVLSVYDETLHRVLCDDCYQKEIYG